jgi:two-component system cell cycle response regulator
MMALLRGARVLIVDDDRVQCEAMARTVREWEAEVHTARDFAEALRLHREIRPDLVMLDVMMPHVDGYKLAQMFKKDSVFTPIILLTALEDLDSKRRGLAAGADEFLTKPVSALELQIRMSSMIRIKRLADELEEANKELNALATIDPLTQVGNRRLLDLRLADEFERSRRYKRPLACLLIDIDHFKGVNDVHGHQVGDSVLALVGRTISRSIRATDMAGRYGGEEFMVLAPETAAGPSRAVAERIRIMVAQRSAETEGVPPVTVSIGVATTELEPSDRAALVKRADEALYQAKREGRNRVIVAD